MRKSIARCLAAAVTAILFLSCASAPKNDPASLIQRPERMFWEIRGANGGVVYVLGTIHLATEELYPLDETVLALFDSADRIAGEISSKDWANLEGLLTQNIMDSITLDDGQFRDIRNYLTPEETAVLTELFTEDMMNTVYMFDPWIITNMLTASLYEAVGFDESYGIDMHLIARAAEAGRTMDGLDEIQTQIDVIRFGTYEQQILMLKSVLSALSNESGYESLYKLYDAYLKNDAERLAALFMEENEAETADYGFMEEYTSLILEKRNSAWADVIRGWLNEGGTTFIFAGAAHFVGEGNVFDIMAERGYLVR